MILAHLLLSLLGVADLNGRAVDPFARNESAQALVFVFIHPDCPVSNRYVPELNRLHAEYKSRDVKMWVVYSGTEDGAEAIRSHYAQYNLKVPALVDPEFALADKAGATMTPEAAIFLPEHTLVYRGRIDDRAPRLGVWRSIANTRDLSDVLSRVTAGETPAFRATQAVGCYIR